MIGVVSRPDSSIHAVPVISPLPLSEKYPAKTGDESPLPRGRIAVTPVRIGPRPTIKIAVAANDRGVTNLDAGDVSDCLERPGADRQMESQARALAFGEPCGAI